MSNAKIANTIMVRTIIHTSIIKAVTALGSDITEVNLEHPKIESHGDFASSIALQLSKQIGDNPRGLAEKIITHLKADEELMKAIETIDVAGPGFINFYIKKSCLLEELQLILDLRDRYGSRAAEEEKSAIVEYSSPNIAKPFTVGHLRSTIIGDAVANLLNFTGWNVYRDNHLGDWGTQFGKQIYAIKNWGNEEKIAEAENPVRELVDLYIKFHAEVEQDPTLEDEGRLWFKKLEDGDAEARRLWKKCIEWSLKEFKRIYAILDVTFTENGGVGYGEAFFEDKMADVIEELTSKGLLKESDGAQLVFFPEDSMPPLMILKKDGSTLYATRDLATDKFRLQMYGKDILIINEVGVEQTLYFRQLYLLEELLGWTKPGQRVHISHGHYRFKDGKMSTRKGNVIWLDDVLKTAYDKAAALMQKDENTHDNDMNEDLIELEKRVWKVAVGALKWNDLKRSSNLDVAFDWEEILRMDGNSGPYLQYTHARAMSVLRKANDEELKLHVENEQFNEDEEAVLRLIYRFSESVDIAAQEFAPHHVCSFLFELAQRFNTFYNNHSILNEPDERTRRLRLKLTEATAVVLQNGLQLLGIAAPERM